MHGLGSELQRRGISRQRQWGAKGIVSVRRLSSFLVLTMYFDRASLFAGSNSQLLNSPKKSNVTIGVGVQTDTVMVGINGHRTIHDDLGSDITEEDAVTNLPASALASVLKWSKDIAADIHLFSGISPLISCGIYSSVVSSPTSYGDCNWSAVRGLL